MNDPVNALTDPLFGKRILHGATFPEKLIEPLIKVGSMVGDTVLDPFCGTGTTGKVSLSNGRKSIGYEINPSFNEIIKQKMIDFSIDELSLTGS
jgi:DNA modification methylase